MKHVRRWRFDLHMWAYYLHMGFGDYTHANRIRARHNDNKKKGILYDPRPRY